MTREKRVEEEEWRVEEIREVGERWRKRWSQRGAWEGKDRKGLQMREG